MLAVPEFPRSHGLRGDGLYTQVINTLGQDIVNGVLAEGDLIFVEQLCARFGVSRSVVREGLRTLASMGLVEARPKVGTRVLPRSRWDLLNPMIVYWRGRGVDYIEQQRELLELRLGIEGTAARLAAERMSAEDAGILLHHAVRMLTAIEAEDRTTFYEFDAKFHRALLDGSGNAIMAQFADTVEAMLQAKSTDHRPGAAFMGAPSARRHVQLAHALVARDPDQAEAVVRQIVYGTLEEFEEDVRQAARNQAAAEQ
ncbi:MAG: FadR/GntR family transcriptional regulator [Propionicimonas sp.]